MRGGTEPKKQKNASANVQKDLNRRGATRVVCLECSSRNILVRPQLLRLAKGRVKLLEAMTEFARFGRTLFGTNGVPAKGGSGPLPIAPSAPSLRVRVGGCRTVSCLHSSNFHFKDSDISIGLFLLLLQHLNISQSILTHARRSLNRDAGARWSEAGWVSGRGGVDTSFGENLQGWV